ncbi:MAG: GNAT family N-acetyltransferase [Ramlibacter sp.]|nr:GNAT family N-acetyltransferase [Ramlibacter sp.]
MTAQDIEAIERATVAAVSPQAQEEIAGWLLPFDTGTVGRARSAVPLAHDAADAAVLDDIEARYAARGLPVMWRLPNIPAFDAFAERLQARGYEAGKPTHVQTAAAASVMNVSQGPFAQTAARPDTAWAAVFVGEGFDPVDGASRVATLSRAPGALFASIREGEATVAAGMGGFSHGWASVHGMRTALACRGRGLAGRVLATLAREARSRGIERFFLQVEASNAPALALYRRAGFETAWTYSYWKKE